MSNYSPCFKRIEFACYFFLKLKSIQDEHFWGCSWIEGGAKRAASLKFVANSPQ